MIDIKKQYINSSNHICPLCSKVVYTRDIEESNVIISKTKRHSTIFAHKNCLIKGR